MLSVNENSTSYVTAVFKEKDGNVQAPDSARYRIDCVTTGTKIKDWTPINNPGSTEEITISKSENAIIDQSNPTEQRVVTVEGTYGVDDGVSEELFYDLINLYSVT